MTRVQVNFNREIFPFWLVPELRFKHSELAFMGRLTHFESETIRLKIALMT